MNALAGAEEMSISTKAMDSPSRGPYSLEINAFVDRACLLAGDLRRSGSIKDPKQRTAELSRLHAEKKKLRHEAGKLGEKADVLAKTRMQEAYDFLQESGKEAGLED